MAAAPKQTHEQKQVAAIHEVMRQIAANTAISDVAQDEAARALKAQDIVAVVRHAGQTLVVLAAESEACKLHGQEARSILAEVMNDTGLTSLKLSHHTLSLAEGRAGFVVTDEKLVPPQYWVQPPAQIDRTAINKALKPPKPKKGEAATPPRDIPGIERTNGEPHVRLVSDTGGDSTE